MAGSADLSSTLPHGPRLDPGVKQDPPRRRSDIQGLRAIAVLVVVAYHAGLPFPGGFVGVDVFFVISGFVITTVLQREWQANHRISFRKFFSRRFMRLTPALALVISFTLVFSAFLLSPFGPQQAAASTAVGAMLLVANFVIARTTGNYFDLPAEGNPLLNTWSLSVEEQFYLFFPFLLALSWFLARRVKFSQFLPFFLVLVFAILSFGLAVTAASGMLRFPGAGTLLGFYSPFPRAWEFAIGALLVLVPRHCKPLSERIMAVLGVVGLVMIAASLWLITDSTPFPGIWTLLPTLGTALVLLSGTVQRAPTTLLLSAQPLVRVGDWSYSIYLWHWPFIVFALALWPGNRWAALIAVVTSLLPALLAYSLVEQPVRLRTFSTRSKFYVFAGITVCCPILISLAVGLGAKYFWEPKLAPYVPVWETRHEGLSCYWDGSQGTNLGPPCVFGAKVDEAASSIMLWGDSNAHQYLEGILESTQALGRPLAVATAGGCPPLDLRIENKMDADFGERCQERNQAILAWIEQHRPGTIVISMINDYWTDDRAFIVARDGSLVNDREIKVSLMSESLERLLKRLHEAEQEVVVVQALPHFQGAFEFNRRTCPLWRLISGCESEMSAELSLAETLDVREKIARIAAENGATVLDLQTLVCPNGKCQTARPGLQVYLDGNHITSDMSQALAPAFTQLFR